MTVCSALRRLFFPPPLMAEKRVLCAALDGTGLHRMAYTQWGDPDNPRVLLCVHGLTRNGRELARISRFFLLGLSNFRHGCLAEEQTFRIAPTGASVKCPIRRSCSRTMCCLSASCWG